MIIGILKEVLENENRVSITPDIVIKFIKLGYSVLVQSNAGLKSNFTDDQYVESGASIIKDANEIWSSADIILKINAPSEDMPDETTALVGSKTLVSFFGPAQHTSKLKKNGSRKCKCIGNGLCAKNIKGAKNGCIKFNG